MLQHYTPLINVKLNDTSNKISTRYLIYSLPYYSAIYFNFENVSGISLPNFLTFMLILYDFGTKILYQWTGPGAEIFVMFSYLPTAILTIQELRSSGENLFPELSYLQSITGTKSPVVYQACTGFIRVYISYQSEMKCIKVISVLSSNLFRFTR